MCLDFIDGGDVDRVFSLNFNEKLKHKALALDKKGQVCINYHLVLVQVTDIVNGN